MGKYRTLEAGTQCPPSHRPPWSPWQPFNVPPHSQLGAAPPPQLSFHGQQLRLESLLGVGATSSVYKCVVDLDGKKEECAVKALQGSLSADSELAVLDELKDGGCDCIPLCPGRLDSPGQGFLLQPLGITLAADNVLLRHPRLYQAIPPMLQALHSAHQLGFVHRDLRLPNLLAVTASAAATPASSNSAGAHESVSPPVSLVILDWWVRSSQCSIGRHLI